MALGAANPPPPPLHVHGFPLPLPSVEWGSDEQVLEWVGGRAGCWRTHTLSAALLAAPWGGPMTRACAVC